MTVDFTFERFFFSLNFFSHKISIFKNDNIVQDERPEWARSLTVNEGSASRPCAVGRVGLREAGQAWEAVKKQEGRELTGIDARSVPDLRPTLSHLVFSTALLSTYDYPHFINGNLKVHKV